MQEMVIPVYLRSALAFEAFSYTEIRGSQKSAGKVLLSSFYG